MVSSPTIVIVSSFIVNCVRTLADGDAEVNLFQYINGEYDGEAEKRLTKTSSSKSVIIQMFEWTWDSVAAECTNFIGPAGYGFVQG